MAYCYTFPHPAVTTDIVVFTIIDDRLKVLLVERVTPPFQGHWALPGGFLQLHENLDGCARRELAEKTDLTDLYLEQLYTFGRIDRDPRERVITVAYMALVRACNAPLRPDSGEPRTCWFPVKTLPRLAFDHQEIIQLAHQRLLAKSRYSTIALQLLPAQFTLGELQKVYEIIQDETLDKRNFRKWVLSIQCLRETGEVRRKAGRRPAKLYEPQRRETVEFIR